MNGRSGKPRRWRRLLLVGVAAVGLQLAFAMPASSHDWSWWHWDKGGSYVPIYYYNYASGSFNTAAQNAINDIHRRPHPVYLIGVGYHTDVSVFDSYVTPVNWCGLASIESWKWWTPWTGHITHAHAQYNRACGGSTGTNGYVQGVYCQEVAHTLGLDHSDTGDCMGLSYFAGSAGRNCFGSFCDSSWSHQALDLYYKYRYH